MKIERLKFTIDCWKNIKSKSDFTVGTFLCILLHDVAYQGAATSLIISLIITLAMSLFGGGSENNFFVNSFNIVFIVHTILVVYGIYDKYEKLPNLDL
jgi:hypothetical protein